MLALPARNSCADFHYYTAGEMGKLANKAMSYYLDQGLKPRNQGESPVVGIFAAATIEWAATFFALVKLGFTPLALSRQLSTTAILALLSQSHCKAVILESTTGETMETLVRKVEIVPEVYLTTAKEPEQTSACIGSVPDFAFITHSSGSTGLPKLFYMSQKDTVVRTATAARHPVAKNSVFITSALYNSAGLNFLLAALTKSTTTYYYNDRLAYTANGLIELLKQAKPDFAIFFPLALELLASTQEGMQVMRSCSLVVNFGAVCPTELGHSLVREGIRFSTSYAMSEAFQLMASSSRPNGDKDWDYMEPYSHVKKYLWMKPFANSVTTREDQDSVESVDQLFECVVLPGLPTCPSSLSNSDDPPGSFYTGDVFLRHPTLHDRWKVIGRKDDQIVMSVAMSLNALDYENLIKVANQESIDEVVVFGNGQKRLGILVFAKGTGEKKKEEIQQKIWNTIESEINGKMKVGIEKQMIVVVLEGTVPRTDKGNVIRPRVSVEYQDLIDAAYANTA